MRRRITSTLAAGSVAGVAAITLGLGMASPAGAGVMGGGAYTPSGGAVIPTNANCSQSASPIPGDNCARAGYQASGRSFRFAQALITVPNRTVTSTTAGDPAFYVALDNSGTATWQYARVGIAPCPAGASAYLVPGTLTGCPSAASGNTSGWVAFVATATIGAPPAVTAYPISASMEGDGVLVNVYREPTGNAVLTTITLPSGATYNNAFGVYGQTYTKALAVEDWTMAVENGGAKPLPAVPSAKVRDAQFLQGRFTTVNGSRGTFSGPWALNALEATSNGYAPPSGSLIGQPSYLWTDSNSFQGSWGDAFGVWRFPF